MLDAWIIEEIRKREEAKREQQRPRLELPLMPPHDGEVEPDRCEESDRGVVVIDFMMG